ncbi:MAG: hypothetical protein Q8P53_04580 [Candidatus Shapirobacteria bacterium]|nr:hypothetical protein [Candidatus Shapirobacteria bacterium]
MDLTQIIIIISVVCITAVIVGCGIWLILILKELRTTLTKTNGILDDTKLITSSVAQPVSSISEFVVGFKNGMNFFNSLLTKKNKSSS